MSKSTKGNPLQGPPGQSSPTDDAPLGVLELTVAEMVDDGSVTTNAAGASTGSATGGEAFGMALPASEDARRGATTTDAVAISGVTAAVAAALPEQATGWGSGGRPLNDPTFSPGGIDNGNDGVPNTDTGPNGVGVGFGSGGRPENDDGFSPGGEENGNNGEGNDTTGPNGDGTGYGAGGNPDKGYDGDGNPDRGPDRDGESPSQRPDDAGPPDWAGGGDGEGPDRPGDAGNPGIGNGDGDGDGDPDRPDPAPTPPDVPLLDPETVQYKAGYTFSIGDITVSYDGQTVATRPESLSPEVAKTVDGVDYYAIDSEFGFYTTDFVGAQDKVFDDDYGEGFVGELADGAGIAISDARTDTFAVPAKLGTWLAGIGGNSVKASTEHYSVMQAILSDQAYPGDTGSLYNLNDNLWLVDYQVGTDGMPILSPEGNLQADDFHHFYIGELVEAMKLADGFDATTAVAQSRDFNGDGVIDDSEVFKAYMADRDFDGVVRNVAVLDFVNNAADASGDTVDFQDGNLNGFGLFGIQDFMVPNESTVLEDIAVGDDYSVTVKDDGKLLYRWGNMVKRPNDVRVDAKIELPDEWQTDDDGDGFADMLYRVTAAELVVNHTVTNNPNDQIRPEDFENEAAIGQLPSYIEVQDPFNEGNVLWVSYQDFYAGDGTFLPSYITDVDTGVVVEGLDGLPVGYYNPGGTVLRDMSLIDLAEGSTLGDIGALSSDLTGGFTEAWYTTMDREPFQADYSEDGSAYDIGPRWRLQPDKYGQDLPGVTIPQDPSDPPPIQNGEEKYEVGADTTTVLNLLDWAGTSPMTLSAGWMTGSGEASVNGVNMTQEFDVAFYVKGDMKPVNLYDAELLMEYEAVTISDAGTAITGTIGGDTLVGRGGNSFDLSGASYEGSDGQADLLVLGYGATTAAELGENDVFDFTIEEDALGLVGFDLDPDNYNIHITQEVSADAENLLLSLDGDQFATLYGVTEFLGAEDFYFA